MLHRRAGQQPEEAHGASSILAMKIKNYSGLTMKVQMHSLSPSALLEVWEKGMTQPAPQKALLLLSAAFPEESPATLAQCSIGQRNALLLTLREWLFGPQFVSVATCPACGERLELQFESSDIRVSPPDEPAESLALEVAGYAVQFRLPNSADLATVQGLEDPTVAQQALLERCLLSVQRGGEETPVAKLPAEVVTAMAEAMEQADPLANIELALSCPACEHQWQALLDILAYVWSELDAWARRVLREVHYLASAYGWSEHEILNMRPWRRQIYMEMIGR